MSKETYAVSPARVAGLLTVHQRIIAKTMAGQIRAVIPKYREIDPAALAGSLGTLVRALALMIENKDQDRFIDITCDIAEMRLAGGFKVGDMVGAGICFLPVLRRFFNDRCTTTEESNGAYAICEEFAMPIVSRFANAFTALEKLKIPVGLPKNDLRTKIRATLTQSSEPFAPIKVLSTFDFIGDDDDDDITIPDARRRP